MKSLYPKYIERRRGDGPVTHQARRTGDKVFSFMVFLLLVFLLNWLVGCSASAPVSEPSRFPAVDCREQPKAFRCQVYMPEVEVEYDQTETEAGFEQTF